MPLFNPSGGSGASTWETISGKPTTIAGFGITDLEESVTGIDKNTHVWIGDSLLDEGYASPSIPVLFGRYASNVNSTSVDLATAGQYASIVATNYATMISGYEPEDYRPGIAFVWLGTNDINNGELPATVYGYLQTIWAAARADGFKVCAVTVGSRTDWEPVSTNNTRRVTLNNSIRSDTTLYDYLMDVDLLIPKSRSDLFADTIHYNLVGRKLLAKAFWDALHATRPVRSPQFHITLAGDVEVPGSEVPTVINFDGIVTNTDVSILTASGPTISLAGDYTYEAGLRATVTPDGAASYVQSAVYVNGTLERTIRFVSGHTGTNLNLDLSGCFTLFDLAVGDTVALYVITDIAAGVTLEGGATTNYFIGRGISSDVPLATI